MPKIPMCSANGSTALTGAMLAETEDQRLGLRWMNMLYVVSYIICFDLRCKRASSVVKLVFLQQSDSYLRARAILFAALHIAQRTAR